MKHRITAALERFSRAMLAPLSYLSAAGLLLVVGALLTSAPLAGVLPFCGGSRCSWRAESFTNASRRSFQI